MPICVHRQRDEAECGTSCCMLRRRYLRFKVNDQVQARVGGRQEMDGGREPQEKSIANSRREKCIANGRRKGQEEAHHRPQVKETVKSWKDAEQEQAAS